MTVITTRLIVAPDGSIQASPAVPPGEHLAQVELNETPPAPAKWEPLPVFDLGPWPEGLSLRREDMYGDDGR